MCYKCEICNTVSEPGQPRLLHVIYRQRVSDGCEEIRQEIPVCRDCQQALDMGVPLVAMLRDHRRYTRLTPILAPLSARPSTKFAQTVRGNSLPLFNHKDQKK